MRLSPKELSGPCVCGREHTLATKDILLGPDALSALPAVLGREGFQRPTLVCDTNTLSAAGRAVQALVPHISTVVLQADGLHADEKAVSALFVAMGETDVLLAVGAGTIHDITRFAGHQRGIPFLSVPTAASVDGFVSTVAAMTWEGYKKTFPAAAPLYVVADTAVIAKAPYRLTASGVSDLLGKYIALADWKISHLVTGEAFCPRVCRMEEDALRQVTGSLDRLRAGEQDGYEALLSGLLLSGLAMQMVGNSRPASGAEHHMSHFWEIELVNGPLSAYHGEKVSVGLLLCAREYERGKQALKKGRFTLSVPKGIETGLLRRRIANEARLRQILEENTPNPLAAVSREALQERIGDIVEALDGIPPYEELDRLLLQAGSARTLSDIGLCEEVLGDTVALSPYVRCRLTFLRLMKCISF